MNTNQTILIVAVVGALAVGGYYLYQRQQAQAAAVLPTEQPQNGNPDTRNNNLSNQVAAITDAANNTLESFEKIWGGF